MGSHTLQRFLMRAAPVFNAPVTALLGSPRFGMLVNRNLAMLSYTGRRSGRRFDIPVAYRRTGDQVAVGVNMPEAKTWWRNFLGGGAPVTLRFGGSEHSGHAIAERDEDGRVTVIARLTD